MINSPDAILVRYGELALKNRNRGRFERQLQDNITSRLHGLSFGSVDRFEGGINVTLREDSPVDTILTRLQSVPGISWYAPGLTESRDASTIARRVLDQLENPSDDIETFAVRTQRSDKSLEKNSMDYEREIGQIILDNTGFEVDLDSPDLTVHVHLLFENSFLFFERREGLAGLPVESSGDVLSLLSGGIDSPVASVQMLKRGCRVDLLHYYPYPTVQKALDSKIRDLVSTIARYSTHGRLFMAPYHEYEFQKAPVSEREEIVLFRRHMMRVADRIAERYGLGALVTGESVGQVASQTLENMNSIQRATDRTILRPLAGLDKNEIIELARRYDTYSVSIEDYQDCCAIQNKRVNTQSDTERLNEIEDEHDLHRADDAVVDALDVIEFDQQGIPEENQSQAGASRSSPAR